MSDYSEIMGLVEEIRDILEDSAGEDLYEAKKHNPFRNAKGSIGPTSKKVAKKRGPREVSRTGEWTCKCANYSCECTNEDGDVKDVEIDKAYKTGENGYNARYNKFRKSKRNKARYKPGGPKSNFKKSTYRRR